MIQKDATPASTVARPSRMKIQAQAGLPPMPPMFEIAACHKRLGRDGPDGVIDVLRGDHRRRLDSNTDVKLTFSVANSE